MSILHVKGQQEAAREGGRLACSGISGSVGCRLAKGAIVTGMALRGVETDRLNRCRQAAKAIAVIYLLAFAYSLQASIVRAPVFDFLDWVRFWGEKSQSGDWLGYLWIPHNEHRAAISRLLLLIDINVFSGTTLPFYASAVVFLAAGAMSASQIKPVS